ncbi:transcription initiation factor TFIID subunit 9B, partial [Lecanoromycetidae sp. Uapishka_2]
MAEPNGTASDPEPQPSQEAPDPPATQAQTDPRNLTSPPSSTVDSGLSRRPRDARLLHMILTNYGVSSYQERVPLQLMDFAYRYTSSTLQDALHFSAENYGDKPPGTTGTGKGAAGHNDLSGITLSALRLSIASRTHYQFNPALPKEFYMELAAERNRVGLPGISREWGVRLPPEAHVLTGQGWDLKEEFDEAMVDGEEGGEGGEAEG